MGFFFIRILHHFNIRPCTLSLSLSFEGPKCIGLKTIFNRVLKSRINSSTIYFVNVLICLPFYQFYLWTLLFYIVLDTFFNLFKIYVLNNFLLYFTFYLIFQLKLYFSFKNLDLWFFQHVLSYFCETLLYLIKITRYVIVLFRCTVVE